MWIQRACAVWRVTSRNDVTYSDDNGVTYDDDSCVTYNEWSPVWMLVTWSPQLRSSWSQLWIWLKLEPWVICHLRCLLPFAFIAVSHKSFYFWSTADTGLLTVFRRDTEAPWKLSRVTKHAWMKLDTFGILIDIIYKARNCSYTFTSTMKLGFVSKIIQVLQQQKHMAILLCTFCG